MESMMNRIMDWIWGMIGKLLVGLLELICYACAGFGIWCFFSLILG